LAKGLKVVPWAGLALDVTLGIGDNVNKGVSSGRIVSDAAVDVAVGAGTIFFSTVASSATTSAIAGSVVPGLGTAIGVGVGVVVGVLIYIGTEVVTINGKSAIDWIKEGLYSFFTDEANIPTRLFPYQPYR
jgi:hypothetical protein